MKSLVDIMRPKQMAYNIGMYMAISKDMHCAELLSSLDKRIKNWLGRKSSFNRDAILTTLITQKQYINLEAEGIYDYSN